MGMALGGLNEVPRIGIDWYKKKGFRRKTANRNQRNKDEERKSKPQDLGRWAEKEKLRLFR